MSSSCWVQSDWLVSEDGEARCTNITCRAIHSRVRDASTQWAVNTRRMVMSVVLGPASRELTIISPMAGITVTRFRITVRAQYDI